MAKARDVVRSALIWSGVAGVTLLAVPPMVLGYPLVLIDPNRAFADRYLRTIARALVKLNPLWKVRVEGTRHLAFGEPFVFVCNHQSFADLLAMCFLGHDTKYLGKGSVFRVPVFGWALRIAGEVPVERGNKESGSRALGELGKWLDKGVSVCVFPEGTRSKDGSIGPFKMGAFKLAIDHGRPIVPVVLAGAGELLPKHSLIFQGRAHVKIRALEPIPSAGRTVEELAHVTRERMLEAFAQLNANDP